MAASTKLCKAAAEGDLKYIQEQLEGENPIDVDSISGYYGYTALMAASKSGQLNVVKYLIERGAKFNTQNSNGETALMSAAQSTNSMRSRSGEPTIRANSLIRAASV